MSSGVNQDSIAPSFGVYLLGKQQKSNIRRGLDDIKRRVQEESVSPSSGIDLSPDLSNSSTPTRPISVAPLTHETHAKLLSNVSAQLAELRDILANSRASDGSMGTSYASTVANSGINITDEQIAQMTREEKLEFLTKLDEVQRELYTGNEDSHSGSSGTHPSTERKFTSPQSHPQSSSDVDSIPPELRHEHGSKTDHRATSDSASRDGARNERANHRGVNRPVVSGERPQAREQKDRGVRSDISSSRRFPPTQPRIQRSTIEKAEPYVSRKTNHSAENVSVASHSSTNRAGSRYELSNESTNSGQIAESLVVFPNNGYKQRAESHAQISPHDAPRAVQRKTTEQPNYTEVRRVLPSSVYPVPASSYQENDFSSEQPSQETDSSIAEDLVILPRELQRPSIGAQVKVDAMGGAKSADSPYTEPIFVSKVTREFADDASDPNVLEDYSDAVSDSVNVAENLVVLPASSAGPAGPKGSTGAQEQSRTGLEEAVSENSDSPDAPESKVVLAKRAPTQGLRSDLSKGIVDKSGAGSAYVTAADSFSKQEDDIPVRLLVKARVEDYPVRSRVVANVASEQSDVSGEDAPSLEEQSVGFKEEKIVLIRPDSHIEEAPRPARKNQHTHKATTPHKRGIKLADILPSGRSRVAENVGPGSYLSADEDVDARSQESMDCVTISKLVYPKLSAAESDILRRKRERAARHKNRSQAKKAVPNAHMYANNEDERHTDRDNSHAANLTPFQEYKLLKTSTNATRIASSNRKVSASATGSSSAPGDASSGGNPGFPSGPSGLAKVAPGTSVYRSPETYGAASSSGIGAPLHLKSDMTLTDLAKSGRKFVVAKPERKHEHQGSENVNVSMDSRGNPVSLRPDFGGTRRRGSSGTENSHSDPLFDDLTVLPPQTQYTGLPQPDFDTMTASGRSRPKSSDASLRVADSYMHSSSVDGGEMERMKEAIKALDRSVTNVVSRNKTMSESSARPHNSIDTSLVEQASDQTRVYVQPPIHNPSVHAPQRMSPYAPMNSSARQRTSLVAELSKYQTRPVTKDVLQQALVDRDRSLSYQYADDELDYTRDERADSGQMFSLSPQRPPMPVAPIHDQHMHSPSTIPGRDITQRLPYSAREQLVAMAMMDLHRSSGSAN